MPNGRCKVHGGKAGAPIKTGLYSQVLRNQLRERLQAAEQVEQPFDLQGELALLRGLLTDVLARMDGSIYREQLEKILEEHCPEIAQRAIVAQEIAALLPDVDANFLPAIVTLTNSIRRVVDTITRMRNDTALTVAEVRFLQVGLETLIGDFLPDPNTRRAFVARLAGLVPRTAARQ